MSMEPPALESRLVAGGVVQASFSSMLQFYVVPNREAMLQFCPLTACVL